LTELGYNIKPEKRHEQQTLRPAEIGTQRPTGLGNNENADSEKPRG